MESGFGVLDAFAFVVFAVLILVAVVIIVSLGKLPGQLAHKWGHPQAAAINAMSWIGIATGGLLWPIAFIWAFTMPVGAKSARDDRQSPGAVEIDPPPAITPPAFTRTTHDRISDHCLRWRLLVLFKVLLSAYRLSHCDHVVAGVFMIGSVWWSGPRRPHGQNGNEQRGLFPIGEHLPPPKTKSPVKTASSLNPTYPPSDT